MSKTHDQRVRKLVDALDSYKLLKAAEKAMKDDVVVFDAVVDALQNMIMDTHMENQKLLTSIQNWKRKRK